MPVYEFVCDHCGKEAKGFRTDKQKPPRFCSKGCMDKWFVGRPRKAPKYKFTPVMHERIKKVYQQDTAKGAVADVAKTIGIPRWAVSKYAALQGWVPTRPKHKTWTEQELKVLENNAHLSAAKISALFSKRGYDRSINSVVLKRKRLRMISNLPAQSAHSLAHCLGVDIKFVTRAIKTNKLVAVRRGTDRTEAQGGDMWHIKDKDIRKFIIDYVSEIDIRKVDKLWFVDLLTSRVLK